MAVNVCYMLAMLPIDVHHAHSSFACIGLCKVYNIAYRFYEEENTYGSDLNPQSAPSVSAHTAVQKWNG